MTQIMTVIKQEFWVLSDAEISMEINPGTVSREKLEAYQRCGVNRLSIGLQSADNEELKILGRIHTWETFVQTWNMVRDLGFHNVNIDLMSALPGQTLESYTDTLKKVLALKPEHISAYSLIIEEGTKFYEWFGEEDSWMRTKELPDENVDRQMYEMTRDLLEEQGYYRYEISNYARRGYECKHNIGYWKGKEYLGLGLGSASLISHVRSSNINDLTEYLALGRKIQMNREDGKKADESLTSENSYDRESNWIAEQDKLSEKEQMEEFMFLGLRMMEGISVREFETRFGKTLEEVYGKQISGLEKKGLLKFENGRYALTLQGIDVSNQVFVEFIE